MSSKNHIKYLYAICTLEVYVLSFLIPNVFPQQKFESSCLKMDEKATYVFPVNEYSFISVTGQPNPTNTDITEWMLSIRVVLRSSRP